MAKKKKLTDREIAAYTILGEAGGEGEAGMAAVAHVLLNRAESGRFPSTIGAVATQKSKAGTYQFTTWSGKHGNAPTKKYAKDSPEFKKALAIVDRVMAGEMDPTGGALHYYANTGANAIKTPVWFPAEAVGGTQQIGNHLFASTGPVNPFPRPVPQAVTNLRAGLTRGGLELPAPLIAPGVKGPIRSGVAAAAGAGPGTGGLITRKVQTIPVKLDNPAYVENFLRFTDAAIDSIYLDPSRRPVAPAIRPAAVAGIRVPAPLAAVNQTRVNLQEKEAARQTAAVKAAQSITRGVTTVITRPSGETVTYPLAGSAEMPRGYQPTISTSRQSTTVRAPSGLGEREAERQMLAATSPKIISTVPKLTTTQKKQTVTKMVAKTITVENPEWGKVNPVAVEKLQSIHDREEARIMAAQTPKKNVPQFITKTIMVPETQTIMVPTTTRVNVPVAPPPPPAMSVVNQLKAAGYSSSQAYAIANSGPGSVAAMEKKHSGGGSSSGTGGGPAHGGEYASGGR